MIERWIYELEGFEYSMEYRRGDDNIADYMSRQNDFIASITTRHARNKTRPDCCAWNRGIRREKANIPMTAKGSLGTGREGKRIGRLSNTEIMEIGKSRRKQLLKNVKMYKIYLK